MTKSTLSSGYSNKCPLMFKGCSNFLLFSHLLHSNLTPFQSKRSQYDCQGQLKFHIKKQRDDNNIPWQIVDKWKRSYWNQYYSMHSSMERVEPELYFTYIPIEHLGIFAVRMFTRTVSLLVGPKRESPQYYTQYETRCMICYEISILHKNHLCMVTPTIYIYVSLSHEMSAKE